MRTKISKKEEASMDAYLRTHAKKPLQKIFTKLEEDNVLPITMNIRGKDGEVVAAHSDAEAVAELHMHVPTVIPGAKFTVDDVRKENGMGVTPYEFSLASQHSYDTLIRKNLENIINGMGDENLNGVKVALEEFRGQLNHILSHNKDLISGLICSNISKLNISAVIEIFKAIYEKYPEKRGMIGIALADIMHSDNELFNDLFVDKDNIKSRRRYIGFNPQIDYHFAVNDTLYNLETERDTKELDSFMSQIEMKLSLSAAEMTTRLYDILFKMLSRIALSTHVIGPEDLDYKWIMDCLDVVAFDILATYHDSLIDMLKLTIIRINAIMYNHGTHRELEQTINSLLIDVNRAYNMFDDEYYE